MKKTGGICFLVVTALNVIAFLWSKNTINMLGFEIYYHLCLAIIAFVLALINLWKTQSKQNLE